MEHMKPAALKRHHLEGRAGVYLRQSTLKQTRENTGSTEYQRGQKQWALRWGFPEDRIDVLDQDLGRSGSAAAHRDDYLRLRDGVRRRIYTVVLVSDLTRLGRDADEAFDFIRDCKVHDVLIAIDGELLDTRHKVDLLRARLGAMFAELDRDNLRDTMERGRRARLQQGLAVSVPPAGYRGKRWEMDPRPEVQMPIRVCFREYLDKRALAPTVAAFRATGTKLPRRRPGGDVEFIDAAIHAVRAILTNPSYKGEYQWGRHRVDPAAGRDRRGHLRSRKADPADVVVIRDHHAAYVTSAEWDEVQRILRANAWTPQHGSMGRGEASLQGAVYCEGCRRRMSTAYRSQRRDGHWSRVYLCIGDLPKGGKQHTGVPGGPLEAVVEREVLARINPVSVEQLRREWDEARDAECAEEHRRKLELHRLRAEVADLEYRYLKVDVDNPHVRRMLGGRLEQAERSLEQLQTSTQLPARASVLDADGFKDLTELSSAVRPIFYAPTTTNRDRKEIIRTLVERVVVEGRTDELVKARIVWADGHPDTPIEVYLSKYAHRLIRAYLQRGVSPSEIAERLNDARILTKYRTPWSQRNVGWFINREKRRGVAPRGARRGCARC